MKKVITNIYEYFRQWCAGQGITRVPSAPEFRKEISGFCKKNWSDMTKRFKQGVFLLERDMSAEWKNDYSYLYYDTIS